MDFKTNERLRLVYDFIQYTGRNIFLTGKAGTGKTTFLKYLKENSPKRMVVVAPTGVAAINAGGVTIHSFFQLSFGPQLPEGAVNQEKTNKHFRFRKNKIDIIRSLDLLVIDEISMVRADLLDGIDRVLRRYRNNNQPFGGVQLLMIGDLQQLTPVAKEEEWNLLKNFYQTPYFFSSQALLKSNYVTIELQHVYRQKDEKFITLLNKIRDNQLDAEVIEEINKRFIPDFNTEKEGYILLTTHNFKADEINDKRLKNLPGKPLKFKAEITGNFPEYNYPTDKELLLKPGAQVMFIKNDPSPEKKFYNGKIGRVVEVDEKYVKVTVNETTEAIKVSPLTWEKTKYELDSKTKEIKEELEGTFTQIPLKLAWAVTIHKSQGLTFDKVIIDARAAFAHGQVYVALSRCRSLEGIILKTPLTASSIKHDFLVQNFTKKIEENHPDNNTLHHSKKEYAKSLLNELFGFSKLQKRLFYLIKLMSEYDTVLIKAPLSEYKIINEIIKKEITDVSEKFKRQLEKMTQNSNDLENDKALQERIKKASVYFSDKLSALLLKQIKNTKFETDNNEVAKKLEEALNSVYEEYYIKQKYFETCKTGFTIKSFLNTKAKAVLEETKLDKKPEKNKTPHPELYKRLRDWRDAVAEENNKIVYMVLPLKTITELCTKLPGNLKTLQTVKGLGKKKVEQYGEEILSIINDYCDEYGFNTAKLEIQDKPKKKNTRQETLKYFLQGMNIQEIARKRNLARSTIAGHIAHLIADGEIDVFQLAEKEKVNKIADYFLNNTSKSLTDAKEYFGEEFDYEELRFVLNHLIAEGKI